MTDSGKKSEPEHEPPLPIKLEPVSNGEFAPLPSSPSIVRARELAYERSADAARRLGLSRRAFLRSSCGAATVLLALNEATGCVGGRYALSREAMYEEEAAAAALSGDELIFDVQTHHVNPERDWASDNLTVQLFGLVAPYKLCGESRWLQCYSQDHYLRELFLDSDTDMAVLSVLPGYGASSPLLIDEMAATREAVDKLEGSRRLLLHGFVPPQRYTRAGLHERMAELAEVWDVAAFKLYPVGGPEGDGYWLDDPERGVPIFEEARRVGVPIVAVHKGLPLPFTDARYARCRDVGNVARMFPDVKLLIYHAGYEPTKREGPYNPEAERGVDRLIRDLKDADIGPTGNVWVDIGSTWRQLMGRPDQAAHVLGKLLAQLGDERVLWGTDSIWYGSPQDQIQAFRAFEITPDFQERYGYPALTPVTKEKILGRNAAAVYGVDPEAARLALHDDAIARARSEYEPRPSFRTYGPRTRRALLSLQRSHTEGGS